MQARPTRPSDDWFSSSVSPTRCPTKCDGRLVGRLNEGRRVCDIQRVRLCGSRVAHAFFEPASRCSIAALLATLLVLIANTRACGSVQPLRSCHAAELPVVQPMQEPMGHNTSHLSVSAHRQILLSLCSAHDRRHIFNVLWCVPAYASLRLARACACCITAVSMSFVGMSYTRSQLGSFGS